jgi:hypothetical protein
LIFKSGNGLLEGFAFALQASVTVNFRTEGTITDLPDGFVHAIMPHVVGVEESEYVRSDNGGRYVDIDYGCCMDLAVVSGSVKDNRPSTKGLGASRWARM